MSEPPPASRAAVIGALTASAGGGVLMAIQAEVNAALGTRIGDPGLAALVSFGSGLVAVLLVLAWTPRARSAIHRLREAGLPAWRLLGGVVGGLFVAFAAVSVPLVGVALFSIAVITGQSVGALIVDRYGLGPSGAHPVSRTRVAGALLTVGSVLLAQLGGVHSALSAGLLAALLTAVAVAGAGTSVQSAFNGVVGRAAGLPTIATLVNFAVGTATLVLFVGGFAVARGGAVVEWPTEPWLYFGGLLGAVFISVNVVAVRVVGVLRATLAIVVGQLAGAVGLDMAAGRSLSGWLLAGCALTLVGVAASNLSRRTSSPPASSPPASSPPASSETAPRGGGTMTA